MDKIFGCKPKAKKVDTTVEDLLQEDTWIGFQPLGDWVKVIPRQLLTLWTSKDANEVRDTLEQLFSSLNLASEEVSNDEAKKDKFQLLLGLVVKIIEFSWPILKSNDALHKEKLFRQLIDLGESLEVLTEQPCSDGPLSPHLALSRAANFLGDLFASAKDNLEMLQCCALAVIRIPGKAISTDNSLMLKLVERLTTITDDATRACFVFSADKLGKEAGSFIKKVTKRQFTDICNDFLTLPDVSLAKLMAAIATARTQASKAPAEVLHVLADYLVHFEAYEKILETTPLKNFMRIHYTTANAVSPLNPACDVFFARVIENTKALNARPDLSSKALSVAIDMLLTYLMDPIPPGAKVIDLHPSSVRLLEALVELDKVWTDKNILETLAENGIPSTKEELVALLADKADDGTKRFPKFEGIDEIPWHELQHAYGKATDVPECLRMLTSPKKESGLRALRYLFSSICHQGVVSSATPYAVPYLVEVLEYKLNQERPSILNLCAFFLKGSRQGYFCSKTGFDVSVEFPLIESRKGEEQADDDYDYNYCVRMHQIEQHLVNGLPVFLNLLNDADPLIRSYTAFVLAFLPRVADQSVPKIKDQLQSETDSSVKASLMLSLGMLLPRVSSHEECLQFFNGQWDNVKDSDDETVKFSVAACVGRLLAGKTPPKFVLDQLLKAIGKEDLDIVYQAFDDPFTLSLDLIAILKADDALTHIIHQFKKETQPHSDIRPVLRTMLSIAFRFERENDKPIQSATLKPEQLEVLQAIVDSKGDEWDIQIVLEREFDLPGTKEQLREFIEKAKAIKDVLEV